MTRAGNLVWTGDVSGGNEMVFLSAVTVADGMAYVDSGDTATCMPLRWGAPATGRRVPQSGRPVCHSPTALLPHRLCPPGLSTRGRMRRPTSTLRPKAAPVAADLHAVVDWSAGRTDQLHPCCRQRVVYVDGSNLTAFRRRLRAAVVAVCPATVDCQTTAASRGRQSPMAWCSRLARRSRICVQGWLQQRRRSLQPAVVLGLPGDMVEGPPAIANGHVYIGSDDGNLLRLWALIEALSTIWS